MCYVDTGNSEYIIFVTRHVWDDITSNNRGCSRFYAYTKDGGSVVWKSYSYLARCDDEVFGEICDHREAQAITESDMKDDDCVDTDGPFWEPKSKCRHTDFDDLHKY